MAWDPTYPNDGAMNVNCTKTRENFVAIADAFDVEHDALGNANAGEHLSGSARAYYDDYDGDITNLPDLIATDHVGFATGRLAIDSDADYKGQTWYFDGAVWKPHVSTRYWSATSAADISALTPGGAWVDLEAALNLTPTMTNSGYWQYDIHFSGSLICTNNAGTDQYVWFRIYDVTNSITVVDTISPLILNTKATGVNATMSAFYVPVVATCISLKVQVAASAGVAVDSDQFTLGVSPSLGTRRFYVKEIPA